MGVSVLSILATAGTIGSNDQTATGDAIVIMIFLIACVTLFVLLVGGAKKKN